MSLSLDIFVLSFICIHYVYATRKFTETDLHKHIFQNYNANVMPRKGVGQPIEIGLQMFLFTIDEIDETRGTITVGAFV